MLLHSVPSLILKEDLLKSVKRIIFKTMLVTQIDDSTHIHVFYQLPVNLYSFILPALFVNIQWSLAQYQKLKLDDTVTFKRQEKQTHYLDNFSLTAPLKFPVWPSHDLHSCLIQYGIFFLTEKWSVTAREDSWKQGSPPEVQKEGGWGKKRNNVTFFLLAVTDFHWKLFVLPYFLWQITQKYFSEKGDGSSIFQVPL